MFAYELEHLCSYVAGLQAPPEIIGPVPEGIRINFYSTGGEVTGPRIRGSVRPVGGDSFTLCSSGVGLIDVRTTVETHDGALLSLTYTGIAELGEDGYERFTTGTAPSDVPLRVAMRWQTAHPAYRWLNRLQCVGIGAASLERSEAKYDVYALR